MTLPNAITVARIALVPVFWLLAYASGDLTAVASFAVFVVASLSDSLDGYVARRHGTTTRAGEFLDPLADKLLVGAALVVLVDLRDFPLWAALVIAVREVAVQVLRVSIVREGGTLPASPAAKAKTAVQIGMVGWWLLPWETTAAHWLWLVAALVTTLWSGAEYFVRYRQTKEKVL
jgi:CDP-diacylglycerol---glycerol-3-phosphate 3-phosphatidyltransferase